MGFFKSVLDSLKLSDDSDYDDYDDYDDYIAAEEERERKKAEKKAERASEPKFSLKETLFRKKNSNQQAQQQYEEPDPDDDMTYVQEPVPTAPMRRPLYDNNTVSIQERRSGYSSGTTTFADRYKAKEAAMYRQQQPMQQQTARPVQQQRTAMPMQQVPVMQSAPRMTRDAVGLTVLKPHSFEDAQEICDNLIDGNPIIVNLEGFDNERAQRLMDFVSGCVYALRANFHQISGYVFIISPADIDVTGDYNALMRQDGFGVPTLHKQR
ncbi:MAG: cell division protein SepF [Lachnospiraceae bacterium]|nr:cell division protein SepF [Lachnospiraceae bacterium]